MKNWFQKMAEAMSRFMYGRYGTDELSMVMLMVSILFSFLSVIPNFRIGSLLSMVLLCLALYRSFSKNIEKRRREYFAYMRYKQKVIGEGRYWMRKWRERKVCRYFKCRQCKTVYRVPKGKGKIEVTCPKYKNKEIRYS